MANETYDSIIQDCLEGMEVDIDCGSAKAAMRARFCFYNWRKREIRSREKKWSREQLLRISIRLGGEENQVLTFSGSRSVDGEIEYASKKVRKVGPPVAIEVPASVLVKEPTPIIPASESVVAELGYSFSDRALEELGYSSKLEKTDEENK